MHLDTRIQPTLSRRAFNRSESANPGLWDGLVGAWVPALGCQGAILLNMAGVGRNADMGSAAWAMNTGKRAIYYNNTPVVSQAGVAMPTAQASVVCCNIVSASTFYMPFSGSNSGGTWNAGGVAFFCQQTTVRMVLDGTTTEHSGDQSVISSGVPYTLIGTYSGATARIYINGVQVYQWDTSGAITNFTGATLGRESFGRYGMVGYMGNVYVYKRVLLPPECLALSGDSEAPFRLKRRVLVRGQQLIHGGISVFGSPILGSGSLSTGSSVIKSAGLILP